MSKIVYSVSSGKVWINGVLQAQRAYSGNGKGLNNSAMETVRAVGPTPRGLWRINLWVDHPHLGRMVAAITPIQVPSFDKSKTDVDRSAFFIHGDNKLRNNTASEGCPIMDYTLRLAVMKSGAKQLEVVD